jgi:hypothetical protein
MSELLDHAGLIVGLLAVIFLPVLLPGLFGRASASRSWSERVANERGWRREPRRTTTDPMAGGSYLPLYTPSSGGDCAGGGGGGGGGDCG